jgi:hypothetical protein
LEEVESASSLVWSRKSGLWVACERTCGGALVGGHLDGRVARCRSCCMFDRCGRGLAGFVDLIAGFFVCEDGEDIVDCRELRELSASRKALQEKIVACWSCLELCL